MSCGNLIPIERVQVIVADGKDAAFQSTLSAGLDIKFQGVRPIARKPGLID